MRTKFKGFMTLILALIVQVSFAQQKTVTGNVSDSSGTPLLGVTVVAKGTTSGASTDFDGNYSIQTQEGATLVFTYIGYKRVEQVVGASNTMNISMAEDAQTLQGVDLVGYSGRSRENLTSAVSSIGSEKIEQMVPTTNIDNMIQGQASGVQVVAASGKPGQNAFVRVRGQGSLQPGGGSPLYIVDGVPMEETSLNAISGSDVAGIQILKDAATTAQYGSRGANGVVIITTKRGQDNSEGVIKYSSRIGITSKTSDNFKMMNVNDKLAYELELGELGVNTALPGYIYRNDEEELNRRRMVDNNWSDAILRDGIVQSHNLSMTGGGEDSNYFFSVGHDRDQGIIDHVMGFERLNARLSLENQVKDWFRLRTNVAYSRTMSDETRDRNNAQNPFRSIYDNNPYQGVYQTDADGNTLYDEDGNKMYDWGPSSLNPIEYVKTNPRMDVYNTIIGNAGADIDLLKNLTYTFNSGIVHRKRTTESYSVPGNRLDALIGDPDYPGSKGDSGSSTVDYTLTNLLNYNIHKNGHNLGLTALQEFNFNELNTYYMFTEGFANPNLQTATSAGRVVDAYTTRNRLTLFSYGAIADYDYESKYLVSASIRRDGSYNFCADNKYGTFWSASAGWNIANEDFFNVDQIDNLKLRASYGTTGNRTIGKYRYAGTTGYGSGYPGGSYSVPTNIENRDLQWEETTMYDIGLEFGMFNNRLRGVVDYYKRSTDNLLFNAPTAYESGIPGLSIASNLGKIENSGIEIELSGDIIRTQDWSWTVGGNITFYDNKIVNLSGLSDDPDYLGMMGPGTYMQWWGVGEKINQFYLIEYAGVDDTNGRRLYYGGDGQTYYWNDLPTDMENRIKKGSVFADLEGGFNTTVTYKGLSLNADFAYKSGNYIYNQMYQNVVSDGMRATDNQSTDAMNFWREPGDAAKGVNPSPLYGSEANQQSTRFLEKGDYVRLRNVTLAYNFSNKALQNTPINSLRIYAQGQNLLTFTKFNGDPEVGISSGETISYAETVAPGEVTLYSYPNRKTVSFGIDITF